jgi:hypothetical protein
MRDFGYMFLTPRVSPPLATAATHGESPTVNADAADADGNPRAALTTREWIRSG